MPAFLAVRPQAALFQVASATTPLPDHSALDLLDDHQRLPIPADRGSACVFTYAECRRLIDSMGYGSMELYPSTLEKAANILYMVTSNRAFQTETSASPPYSL